MMLFLVGIGSIGVARGQMVDQRYDPDPVIPTRYQPLYSLSGTLGQEFTPTMSSLNFVDLYVNMIIPGAMSGSFDVRIRRDNIGGEIIGTSEALFTLLSIKGEGEARVRFETAVPLTPGQRYVAELELAPGNVGLIYFLAFNGGSYSGGRAILHGNPALDVDLWFREGFEVPEPTVLVLASFGGLLAFIVTASRRNVSPGRI
jgi:hypothetical protein